jgi:hypothetical protein
VRRLPRTVGGTLKREAYRRLANVVRRREPQPLLNLDDVGRRLRIFEQSYVGIRPIRVDAIVGTLGREGDFDRDFLPKRPQVEQRWRNVDQAFPEGDFPPITVYELDGRYFVVDGHHRVAVARRRGVEYIDAEITRLRARWPLPEGADLAHVIMVEQQRVFMDQSGLERARPEVRIEFSRPQGYIELLEDIKVHGFHMMTQRGTVLSMDVIAGDWYDSVYLPTVRAIKREGLWDLFPEATKADLYLWVSQRRRDLFPERGGMDIDQAVRAARDTTPPKKRAARRQTRPRSDHQASSSS